MEDKKQTDLAADMDNFIQQKAKEVQLGTSKKVIKQFLKKVIMEERETQTNNGNRADELIVELKQRVKDQLVEFNDTRAELYNAKA